MKKYPEDMLKPYVKACKIYEKVRQAQVPPAEGNMHPLKPGDQVCVRAMNKESFSSRWKGPYLVQLTQAAVKVKEKPDWLHATRCELHHSDGTLEEKETQEP